MSKNRNEAGITCLIKETFPGLEQAAAQKRKKRIAEARLEFEMQRLTRQYGPKVAAEAENEIRHRLGLTSNLPPIKCRTIDATIPEPRAPSGKRKPRPAPVPPKETCAEPAEKFFASEAERDRSVEEDLKFVQRVLESSAPEEDRKRARDIILNMRLACYGRREKE